MQTEIMSNTHPDWDNFINAYLYGMIDKLGCAHNYANTNYVLDRFYPTVNPAKSIEHFKSKGGFCDCEIMMNVYHPVPENIKPLLDQLKY